MTDNCQRCEDSAPSIHCLQCGVLLCQECSSCLHSLGVFTRHSLTRIEKSSPQGGELCKHHSLPLTHFCTEEWLPLCNDCLPLHESHPLIIFAEAVAETMHEINTKSQRLSHSKRQALQEYRKLDCTLQELNSNAQAARNSLGQNFEALKHMIEWKEEELLSSVEHSRHRKQIVLDNQKEKLEARIKRIEGVLDLLENAGRQSGQVLLSSLGMLSSRIDNVVLEMSQGDKPVNSEVSVNANFAEIKALIEQLSITDQEPNRESTPKKTPSSQPGTPQGSAKSPKTTTTVIRRSAHKPTKSESKILKKSDSNLRSFPDSQTPRTPFALSSKAEGIKPNITPRTPSRTKTFTMNYSQDPIPISPRLSEVDSDPYSVRQFIKKLATSTAIQVSWTHPPVPLSDLVYALEYGVGMKVGGIEQFRQVYKGPAHTCIITDLLPKTSYRFRIASVNKSTNDYGEWSEVVTITTNDAQSVDPTTCGVHASIITRANEKWVQFDRPGTVFASCPLNFSKHCWEVKLVTTALFMSEESSSTMKIGISSSKSKNVIGCLLPYSGGKGPVKAKLILDLEARTLTCYTQANPHGEVFSSLPEGPLIPAFMNKPAKSAASVKMLVNFDQPIEFSL